MAGKKFCVPTPLNDWHLKRTGWGELVLRDRDDLDPLRHPDPLVRLSNVHLAAMAPLMREMLNLAAHRLMHLESGYKRDDDLANLCLYAVTECTPLASEWLKLARWAGQLNLDLEEAA